MNTPSVVLGVNGKFALDADYLSREGLGVNLWAAAVLRKLCGCVVDDVILVAEGEREG